MRQLRQLLLADKGIIILEILLLAVLLFWRFRLGLTRYFDIDEYAHLHWGYSFYIGERPYTDFFYLFPPFFLYPIASLFAIFGRSLTLLSAARIFVFFVFTSMVLILFLIGRKLRGSLAGLTTVVIFAFLPLPSDKMIEVRPDLLATLLSLLGLYLFIEGEERKKRGYFFLSGLFYSLSLGFVPKTVFFLIPPILVLGYKFFFTSKRVLPLGCPKLRFKIAPIESGLKASEASFGKPSLVSPACGIANLITFLAGFLPSVIILILLIFSFGNPSFAVYSMTRMASSITSVLGKKFYMRPDIFFYQNETYYGIAGYSLPYLANLVIYISASLWAIHKFISLGSSTSGESLRDAPSGTSLRNTPEVSSSPVVSYGDIQAREFLVAGSFFANLYAFVFVYPLKHAQYLIPVAPFIAFYFADLVTYLTVCQIPPPRGSHSLSASWRIGLPPPRCLYRLLFLIPMLIVIGLANKQMYERKMQLGNKPTFDKIAVLLKTIPRDVAIFDLTGESIFFPDGYYFCCLPYGQYEEALGFKLPNLEHDLEKRNTKYVYTGSPDRLDVLPSLQAKYIRDNFIPYFPDGSLLIKK